MNNTSESQRVRIATKWEEMYENDIWRRESRQTSHSILNSPISPANTDVADKRSVAKRNAQHRIPSKDLPQEPNQDEVPEKARGAFAREFVAGPFRAVFR